MELKRTNSIKLFGTSRHPSTFNHHNDVGVATKNNNFPLLILLVMITALIDFNSVFSAGYRLFCSLLNDKRGGEMSEKYFHPVFFLS